MLPASSAHTVLGIGSAFGTWWVNAGGRRVPRAWLLGGGLMIVGVGMATFALSTRYAVFAVSGLIIGLAAAPAFVLSETLLQEGTEPRQRGRVFSARDFLMRLVFLLGGTTAGFLSRAESTPVPARTQRMRSLRIRHATCCGRSPARR